MCVFVCVCVCVCVSEWVREREGEHAYLWEEDWHNDPWNIHPSLHYITDIREAEGTTHPSTPTPINPHSPPITITPTLTLRQTLCACLYTVCRHYRSLRPCACRRSRQRVNTTPSSDTLVSRSNRSPVLSDDWTDVSLKWIRARESVGMLKSILGKGKKLVSIVLGHHHFIIFFTNCFIFLNRF